MFKEIADIKTSDQLKLPVPEAEYETVVLKPTEQQKEIVESLGERALRHYRRRRTDRDRCTLSGWQCGRSAVLVVVRF